MEEIKFEPYAWMKRYVEVDLTAWIRLNCLRAGLSSLLWTQWLGEGVYESREFFFTKSLHKLDKEGPVKIFLK